jgi:carbon-monoxide dehydrogenase small subunit
MTQKITLTINGKSYTDEVEPRLLLIHYLREVAGLTGPHRLRDLHLRGAPSHARQHGGQSATIFAVSGGRS